jgi:hypothetical protein
MPADQLLVHFGERVVDRETARFARDLRVHDGEQHDVAYSRGGSRRRRRIAAAAS